MDLIYPKVVSLTKKMRITAYKYGKIQSNMDCVPFGASIRESIGPFPEFILKGRYCSRSTKGYCSPCFYSRLPINRISKEEFDAGYIAQVEHIVEHFGDKVIPNQKGKVAQAFLTEKPVYSMVCTPTGSYFDEKEYPVATRKKSLKVLLFAMEKYSCEIILHIESHAEDVINYFSNPDNEELELLRKLHTRILLGFESVNNISRNAIYAKQLQIDDFQTAVCLLKEYGFPVGAFVFAGLFSLTEEETISDVNNSIVYLKTLGVSPVLMFANTQAYTISDVLLQNGRYKLLDPRTVYTIIKNMLSICGCNMNGDIDPWFIADPKGGPPDPNLHIFNSSAKRTCRECSDLIYNAIEQLRITKNIKPFLELENVLDRCVCRSKYTHFLDEQEIIAFKDSIYNRLMSDISYADKMFSYYTLHEIPWLVKAELLCYGLNITHDQISELAKTNPFIMEKGVVNAVHVLYGREDSEQSKGSVLINLCVAEKNCMKSPYTIQKADNTWHLIKNNIDIGEISFLSFPAWVYRKVDNIMIGDVIRPHSNKCISIWPSMDCQYVKENKGCNFCGLTSVDVGKMIRRPPKQIAHMVQIALAENPYYEINLSGGTCESPDKSIEYITDICRQIKSVCKSVPISVECVPPSDFDYLSQLKDSGATAIIMNIEVYNSELRKEICPGKGDISVDYYFKALSFAVDLFGKGNVSSVLIAGIQPKVDIIEAAKKLINLNIIPTIIPFKPLDGTLMENHPVMDPYDYIAISRSITNEMIKKDLVINSKSGCAACGACSLETNLVEVFI